MQSFPTAKIHAQRSVNFVQFPLNMHNACAYNYSYAQIFTFIVHITSNMHSGGASKILESQIVT